MFKFGIHVDWNIGLNIVFNMVIAISNVIMAICMIIPIIKIKDIKEFFNEKSLNESEKNILSLFERNFFESDGISDNAPELRNITYKYNKQFNTQYSDEYIMCKLVHLIDKGKIGTRKGVRPDTKQITYYYLTNYKGS